MAVKSPVGWMSRARKDKLRDKDKDSADAEPLQRTPSNGSSRRSTGLFNRSLSLQSVQSAVAAPTEGDSWQHSLPSPSPPRRAASSTSLEGFTEILQQDRAHNDGDSSTRPPLRSNASSTSDLTPTQPQRPFNNNSGTFSKYSLTSMLTLGLVRDKSDEGDRGRSLALNKDSSSSSRRPSFGKEDSDRSRSRGRSISPFRMRSRSRGRRDTSPSSMVEALSLDADSDSDSDSAARVGPRSAFSRAED